MHTYWWCIKGISLRVILYCQMHLSNIPDWCINILLHWRKENGDYLNAALGESSKHRRHRVNVIGLQTSILSWSVEFVTGGLVWIDLLFSFSSENSWARVFISVLDSFLFSIILPITYIIKTKQIKERLSKQGWYNTLRGFLNCNTNQVAPPDAFEMNAIPGEPQIRHNVPLRIPTISENVQHGSRGM